MHTQGSLDKEQAGVALEGKLLRHDWQIHRNAEIQQEHKKREEERRCEERKQFWERVVFCIFLIAVLGVFIFRTFFLSQKDAVRVSPPVHKVEQEENQEEHDKHQPTAPRSDHPTDFMPSPYSENDPPPIPPAERFERFMELGAGRLAGLQRRPQGWMLLDQDSLPVIPTLFRRMDPRGFKNNRLKVKLEKTIFYISPDGKPVSSE